MAGPGPRRNTGFVDPVIGGGIIAGGASLLGGWLGNRASRAEAAKNRKFQERMRNTQWQAAVADMQKAGLNPALAYSQGPAAAPGGSMATQSDFVSPAVSSAMQMRRLNQDIKLMNQQIREQSAKAAVAEDQEWWSRQRREYYDREKSAGGVGGRSAGDLKHDQLMALLDSEHGKAIAEALQQQAMAQMSGLGGQVAGGFASVMPAFGRIMQVAGKGADSVAGVVEMLERVARMRDDAVQAYLGIPKRVALDLLRRMKNARN